ncbi:MAG: type II toxin-antitoxin system prevent-host-death family antitoxin [Clostridiaceae bacterium]|nr:type II toxin-antitoxin system prevent-host-death family antitoxin [Clostridiaceae bacterium]
MSLNKHEEGLVISATELKLNLGKYLDMTMDKKEVVITKNKKKIARLTPYVTDIEAYFAVRETAHDYVYGGKKVSYSEFMQIYENSNQRMEYINGEIYLLSSPSSFHQDILGYLYILFNDYFKDKTCKVYLAPFDVHFYKKDLKDPDVMQPDITIACDYKTTIDENGRYMGTPAMVVEILSSSTRSKDMVDKLNTYMLSGVKEYWIIDNKNKCVYAYNFIDYSVDIMKSYNIDDTVISFNFDGLKCDVEELFESLK